jgi:hypothetical protein
MDHPVAYETFAPPATRTRLFASILGVQTALYEAPDDPERRQRLVVDANGRWLIIAETGGPNDRVGLFDLHSEQLTWLPAPGRGTWSISDPVLSDGGDRLCVAARPAGLPLTELFIYALDGEHPTVVAGVALQGRRTSHSPVFLPGGRQLLFVQAGDGEPGELVLLELERDGASAQGIQGHAPSALCLRLTTSAHAQVEITPAHCATLRRTVFAVATAGGRVGLMAFTPGSAPRPFAGAWDYLELLCTDPDGRWLAFCDAEQLWIARLDAPQSDARPVPGRPPSHLRFHHGVLYCTRGTALYTVNPETLTEHPLLQAEHPLGRSFALPADPRALARIVGLGLEPPQMASDEALAARADLHAWFASLPALPDPMPSLRALGELTDDPLMRHLVEHHLATQHLRVSDDPTATSAMLFALAAAAQIGVGRPTLRTLCARAHRQLGEAPALPGRAAFLALWAQEHDTFELADALAGYSVVQSEWRTALGLPEGPGRAAVEVLIGGLRARLHAVIQRPAEPTPEPTVDPKDAPVAALFAADRAAAERAHAQWIADQTARTERARAARIEAERDRAVAEDRAARDAIRAEAQRKADDARVEANARTEARAEKKRRRITQVQEATDRSAVAALAAAAARRADAEALMGTANADAELLKAAQSARDAAQERAHTAEATRTAAEAARTAAENQRDAAQSARDEAEVARDHAQDAQASAELEAKAARAEASALQARLKASEAERTAAQGDAQAELLHLQTTLDVARDEKDAAEQRALEAHTVAPPQSGSPLIPAALAAILAGGGTFALMFAGALYPQVAQVPAWAGAALGAALGGLLGGVLMRPRPQPPKTEAGQEGL